MKVKAPINMLTTIADNVKGVSFIKMPDKLIPVVESEGVDLSEASSYHSAGYNGSGVKVAIIDVGFAGLSSAISDGELPNDVEKIDCTVGCVATDFALETEKHGSAVAEIVYDMAPGAKLYLIKVADTLDLLDAKNYSINNGIEIINHSLVVANTNFYDGQCWPGNAVCSADDAYANGILWVNAAGNEATQHYEAIFSDSDFDGWHNVSGSDESINIFAFADDTINVYLTWDAWPTTNQDYDLALYFGSNLVEQSTDPQTGTQWPTEEIIYYVPVTGTYYLSIKKFSATSNHQLEVYSVFHDLTPAVTSSSLLSPADATGAMAVGAINQTFWATGPQESFSSQGPTNDGRIKPDICGPDFVSSYINNGWFAGTSAASPHVAGAAALILHKNPTYSVSQLWNALTSSAIDMGSCGKDNIYGYGRLNLGGGGGSNCVSFAGGGGGGGGGCFIDTAAYGSPLEP
jgi:subtilisin family serine protease